MAGPYVSLSAWAVAASAVAVAATAMAVVAGLGTPGVVAAVKVKAAEEADALHEATPASGEEGRKLWKPARGPDPN